VYDAYLFAIEWNQRAVIDALKGVKQILDAEIRPSK
jgi:hypothetical protein